MYKNEKAVGRAIKKSKVDRSEIFITTKLWPTSFSYEKACNEIDDTLKRLGTDYIDLLLLHQEVGEVKQAWRAMEEAVEVGKVRAIGVSNFSKVSLDKLMNGAKIIPTVVQNECHPYFQEKDFRKFLSRQDIKLMSWYPLGHGDMGLLRNAQITELSKKYNKSNAQLILKWHIQTGIVPIPSSRNPEHIAENIDIFDFDISEEDMKKIAEINKDKRYFKMPMFVKQIAFTRGNIDFNNQV